MKLIVGKYYRWSGWKHNPDYRDCYIQFLFRKRYSYGKAETMMAITFKDGKISFDPWIGRTHIKDDKGRKMWEWIEVNPDGSDIV